jgi:hypothetical protein
MITYLSHELVLMIFVLILFELFTTQWIDRRTDGMDTDEPLEQSGYGHQLFAIFLCCVSSSHQIGGCVFRGGRMKEL